MMVLALAVALTVCISALCSAMEAMLLSTTPADIETLKSKHPKIGDTLENLRAELDDAISAILTLNTVANTLGAVIVGGLATRLFGDAWLGAVSAVMTLLILIFSEILPKNMGVLYRRPLQRVLTIPLDVIRLTLRPLTYAFRGLVRTLLGSKVEETDAEEEISLLAERGAREGEITTAELNVIQNVLTLEDCRVKQVMTPRNVVLAVSGSTTALDLLREQRTIRFGRMPVYDGEDMDAITGVVRRRDILHAIARGEGTKPIREFQQEAVFIPEVGTLDKALAQLVHSHQQLGVVVDEFGGFAGVVTIEDIIEHIIGMEIYERDDMAIDMRSLALNLKLRKPDTRQPSPPLTLRPSDRKPKGNP